MQTAVTRPYWRVWTYETPAVVLGCSQRAYLDGARARLAPGMELLQRPSGGGAVLCGPWMVSCSVVLPPSHPWVQGRLPDSYQGLGQLHAQVLAPWGVAARALPPDQVAAANARGGPVVPWACYSSLAPWEVVDAAGRKLVGLAQRRQRAGVLLVAGTLVTPPDWALLCQALDQQGDEAALRARTVSCAELSARAPDAQQMASALRVALTQTLGEEAGDGAGEAADDSARQATAPNRP
ncbi:biotin/lipoate A/B protein ligase [[Acidovorax] ebreus TPSY]|uniref:Biotin/lipoate A/B protein ligase n=2 Tax=Diaphorobacter TaxID=238749 RepID=A0A9J9QCS2_ACIET|nr:biotin/lipoate A/B protein ligase [[Acidovorax] ebreus TPSY]